VTASARQHPVSDATRERQALGSNYIKKWSASQLEPTLAGERRGLGRPGLQPAATATASELVSTAISEMSSAVDENSGIDGLTG